MGLEVVCIFLKLCHYDVLETLVLLYTVESCLVVGDHVTKEGLKSLGTENRGPCKLEA